MFENLHEECGIFGIWSTDEKSVVSDTYTALYALQHRGQESCGIAVNDSGVVTSYKDLGLVPDVFTADTLKKLGSGTIAIGHVRYAPSNKQERANAQPLVMRYVKGTLAVGHNGSIVNIPELREELEQNGAIFQTTGDAEIISYVIANERLKTGSIQNAVLNAMNKIKGAYSLVIMSPKKLIAARDPLGFRPLCIGKLDGGYVFSSETCALDGIGAEFIRDIEPGEVVYVDESGLHSIKDNTGKQSSLCIFEHVYFARPDSVVDGMSVHEARKLAGKILAETSPVEADIIVGVPDSGLDGAVGYSEQSGIPFGIGFIKNRYIGRTFIQDTQKERERSVKIKLNPISSAVQGKRVVLIDDSIVRGTTCAHIVELLRQAGATEVHMRISSPPFLHPCYFGTDISSRDKLIAHHMTTEQIRAHIGADSLGYLPLERVRDIAPHSKCGFCDACFSGNYPMEVPDEIPVNKYERRIVKNY